MDTLTEDPRWQAVMARDAGADFVYAVTTTGVYCRPACPSRRAKPEHVRFFDDAVGARAAGFRPCLRCNPDGPSLAEANAALVAEACRLIGSAEEPPALAEIAAKIGLSPWYFHRLFRAQTGLTPRAWAAAQRAERLREGLAGAKDVTGAIHEAGFGSNSRFYEKADDMLGMTAQNFRRGGRDETIRFAIGQCSLGAILVAQSARGICAITLGDDPAVLLRDLEDRFPKAELIGGDEAFEALVARVVGLVEAPRIGLDLPLDIRGTAFQERVWQALRQVPPGATVTYAELAQRIGAPKAVRAVAGACAANPLAVAIPCHRVIRSTGALSGYRWGVERKQALLDREA